MSDAGLSAPDKDARIAELEAALATVHADITARDFLIDTLRVQLCNDVVVEPILGVDPCIRRL